MTARLQPTEIPNLLNEAAEARLWGTLQFDFQDGEIVLIRRTETVKIGEENNRHERTHTR
jgi:hypothetical protein